MVGWQSGRMHLFAKQEAPKGVREFESRTHCHIELIYGMLAIKECSRCKNPLSIDNFSKDSSRPDGLSMVCKTCTSIRYQERYKIKNAIRCKLRHTEYREFLAKYFEGKCCYHCKETNPVTFDFHHLDETKKEFTLGGSHMRKWANIVTEIDKCVILCNNCHRKVHHSGLILQLPYTV